MDTPNGRAELGRMPGLNPGGSVAHRLAHDSEGGVLAPDVRSVLILVADQAEYDRRGYIIKRMADGWRRHGIAVTVADRLPGRLEADLVVNHVDLTVTPPDVAAFLARCPRTINGRLLDISKRRVASGVLTRPGTWSGPVVVKTDLNSEGGPEARRRPRGRWRRRWARARRFAGRVGLARWLERPYPAAPYSMFSRDEDVPTAVWSDRRLVVQPFVAERDGPLYAIRLAFFLGGRSLVLRVRGREPVVKSSGLVDFEVLPGPPPEIDALRARLGMNYGKIDYVERDGRMFVLDVNRTPVRRRRGAAPGQPDAGPLYEKLVAGLADV